VTASSRQGPGTPLRRRSPRSSKVIPEPATTSTTVRDTRTPPGACLRADSGPGVHGDAVHRVSRELDFAGVQTGPDREAQAVQHVPDRGSAADGTGGAVEGGEKPVPAVSISRPRNRDSCSRTSR
jgi:hypothetical protein